MSNIFSKFFMSFGFNKKNKYLPAGSESETVSATTGSNTSTVVGQVPVSGIASVVRTTETTNAVKPLASFDISIEKPRYQGAIPEATIKFYPVD